MFKTIWSSRGKVDDFLGLSAEDKRRELTNWFDDEMVNQLGDDELDKFIADDPGFFDDAADDFEYNVSPMIANQFNGGFILDEKFNLVDPGCLLRDANADCEIREDEVGNLVWKEEGRKEFPILGFSDDHQEFLNQLEELDILSTIHNIYPNWDDDDIEVYDVADLIPMDWTLLEQVLTHAKDTQSIGEELEIDEAKAKNPSKLEQELGEIKDLAEEYGREYFTQMPFTSFDNDPISIEMQYPEFFRIVKAFFKEMEILSPEELNDPDELDVQWDQGIDKHDWDVLMKACDKLVNGKGVQFEKEYKTGYNSPLDDDEILAKREESLNEDEDDFDDDDEWYHYDENGLIDTYWLVNEEGDMIDGVGDFKTAMAELPYYPDAVKILHKKSKDESFRWFDDFEEVVWEKGVDESLEESIKDGDSFFMTTSFGGMEGRDKQTRYFVSEQAARDNALKDTWNDGFRLYEVIFNEKADGSLAKEERDLGKIECGRDVKRNAAKNESNESLNEDTDDIEYAKWKSTLTPAHINKIVGAISDDEENSGNIWVDDHYYLFDTVKHYGGTEDFAYKFLDEYENDESLTEAEEPRKFEEDNRFIYVGIGDDQHDIGEIWDDGTIELYEPEKWSKEDRAKMLRDLESLGFYNCSFLEESLKEDKQFGSIIGENNAEDFLQYLKNNDCDTTGYFSDDPVKIDYMGDVFEIRLYSQSADMTFSFYKDGQVEVTGYDDDGDTKTEFNEYFEDYQAFVDWYKSNNIAWGSDLGYSLGENLNEDTVTWPWGDPEAAIPHEELADNDHPEIDKYL